MFCGSGIQEGLGWWFPVLWSVMQVPQMEARARRGEEKWGARAAGDEQGIALAS